MAMKPVMPIDWASEMAQNVQFFREHEQILIQFWRSKELCKEQSLESHLRNAHNSF